MDRFYPNFYSLQSAPVEPLDPRFKRRSWTLGLGGAQKLQQQQQSQKQKNPPQLPVRSQRASSEARISTFLPEPGTPVAVVKPNCGIVNPVALRPQFRVPMCMPMATSQVGREQYFSTTDSSETSTLSRQPRRQARVQTLPRRPKPDMIVEQQHHPQQQQQRQPAYFARKDEDATQSLTRRHSLFEYPVHVVDYGLMASVAASQTPMTVQSSILPNQTIDRQSDLTLRRRARRRTQQSNGGEIVGSEPIVRRQWSFCPPHSQQSHILYNYTATNEHTELGTDEIDEELEAFANRCSMRESVNSYDNNTMTRRMRPIDIGSMQEPVVEMNNKVGIPARRPRNTNICTMIQEPMTMSEYGLSRRVRQAEEFSKVSIFKFGSYLESYSILLNMNRAV